MSQYIIHQSLKYDRGICQPKQHKWILEMPQIGVKCGLPFITLLDVDRVLDIVQVQLNKGIGLMQQSKSRIKKRKTIFILSCDVEPPKINART